MFKRFCGRFLATYSYTRNYRRVNRHRVRETQWAIIGRFCTQGLNSSGFDASSELSSLHPLQPISRRSCGWLSSASGGYADKDLRSVSADRLGSKILGSARGALTGKAKYRKYRTDIAIFKKTGQQNTEPTWNTIPTPTHD